MSNENFRRELGQVFDDMTGSPSPALPDRVRSSLADVPEKIDLVDVFRRPEYVDEIVAQAIQLKIPAIWLQEGVVNERAAEKARKAGMFVVMDRCVLKEHRARFG